MSLEGYAEAIHNKGAALDNCIGFIDGTETHLSSQGITKSRLQWSQAGSRTKKKLFTMPNGMIANMYGPVGKSVVQIRPQIKLLVSVQNPSCL